jgi:restriction system protein
MEKIMAEVSKMITFIIVSLLLIIGALMFYIKKRGEYEAVLLSKKIDASLELKKTMAMGLALRFNYPKNRTVEGNLEFEPSTDLFLKQTPYEFEDFVADIFRKKFGGTIFVTSKSGDFGVDFEHNREDGLYLGQVKVYRNDINYEPIAIIHSNMVKENAIGGYVITTSGFTEAAKEYAKNLKIDLIDGVQLVDHWLESMGSTVYETNNEYV